jgi:leader peptidase (prepilin peptidase)/N-methyltransferase
MGSDHFSLLATTISITARVSIAGVVGLFVGSFLNVVIYRAPHGLSVAAPRSFCPTCGRTLAWWENVPIASWAGLRGRCHTCRSAISLRYPAVEATTGLTFALITWSWAGSPVAAGYCCLASTLIAVSLIEYGGERAPLGVAAVGTGMGQLLIIAGASWDGLWPVLLGSVIGSLLAAGVFSLLRLTDPTCSDPRGHGRSTLLVAGCWAGGLGLVPAIAAVTAWIIIYGTCMMLSWASTDSAYRGNASVTTRRSHPIVATPLVTSVAFSLIVALVVGAR